MMTEPIASGNKPLFFVMEGCNILMTSSFFFHGGTNGHRSDLLSDFCWLRATMSCSSAWQWRILKIKMLKPGAGQGKGKKFELLKRKKWGLWNLLLAELLLTDSHLNRLLQCMLALSHLTCIFVN